MSDTHERNSDEGAPSDGSAGPALPAGVLKTRTAWSGAGDDMEMEHQREQYRRARGGGVLGWGGPLPPSTWVSFATRRSE